MFSGLMLNTWITASVVAAVAGAVIPELPLEHAAILETGHGPSREPRA